VRWTRTKRISTWHGWTRVREVETMHGGSGHSEIRIENLRIPARNMLGGRGQGHRLGQ